MTAAHRRSSSMPAASRPAYTASTTLVPDPQNRPRTRCPGWLYWVMMRCDEGHHGPTGAAWSGSSVPAVPPTPAGASHRPAARRYSPASSRHSSIRTAGLLAPLALRPAFPASLVGRYSHDYSGASAPPRGHGLATRLPIHRTGCPAVWAATGGSHVRHETACPGRWPAIPRQLRHTYAADLQRGLPTGEHIRLRS